MPVSEAHKRATDKYMREKIDDIKVRVPKGQREAIRAHAEKHNESVNAFIWRAIQIVMAMDDSAEE